MPEKWLTPKEQKKLGVHYDAYYDKYLKDDGSDTPAPNFKVNEYTSKDGMRKEFSRGTPLTPEGHAQVSAERLAYESTFGGGYQENEPYRETKGLARWLFGK
jgi:hypothetical protein